jgi:flagellar basal body-associated protein FliL
MASSGMLTEKLILALNSAKDVIKSEDSQIVKNLMTSLNDNKEKFSDDSTIDEIRAAVEARQQERANEDEVILGVEPEETTEEPAEETTEESPDEANEETKEEEDIMSKFKWVLISIGIFVFLIIVGSVFYWYFSSQPEETVMQPQSNIQPITAKPPPPQNVEVEPAKNYSYLPFMSTAVPNANKSNELEKQEQERKRMEQEAELKRIEEQQEKLKQEEEQRMQEEKLKQEEEQRMHEEKLKQEEEQRMQEEQQKIRDDKEEQEKLIKQSLDDNKDLNNNSTYNISKSTPYTDTSSSSSESSDDDNRLQKKGGKTKKQVKQVKQDAKRKYIRKTK